MTDCSCRFEHCVCSSLDAARDVTQNDRRRDYGPPAENHRRTATLWSAYLHARGHPAALSPEDVCAFNILQKMAREMHEHKPDNLTDMIGYVLNWSEVVDSRK